jgi:hypothetical protein
MPEKRQKKAKKAKKGEQGKKVVGAPHDYGALPGFSLILHLPGQRPNQPFLSMMGKEPMQKSSSLLFERNIVDFNEKYSCIIFFSHYV